MITGNAICLHYGNIAVLKNVSFELKEGSITTLCGPSGGGKTSLLKCLAHLLSHYEGSILYKSQDVKGLSAPQRASLIGFVLQQYHLFPHLSVLDNCTYALMAVLKLKKEEAHERAIEMLHLLHMGSFVKAFPAQLSGGQQQRVALARALVLRPPVLLLDEPTAALDPVNKKSLKTLLFTLKDQGITTLLSSHDIPFVQQISDEIYMMEQGQLFKEKR